MWRNARSSRLVIPRNRRLDGGMPAGLLWEKPLYNEVLLALREITQSNSARAAEALARIVFIYRVWKEGMYCIYIQTPPLLISRALTRPVARAVNPAVPQLRALLAPIRDLPGKPEAHLQRIALHICSALQTLP